MAWLHHPSFERTRREIISNLYRKEYRFRRGKSVVFLCGGFQSKRRLRIKEYLLKQRSDILVFFAEDVWRVISRAGNMTALQMEARLAELADAVIVIVESAGTFAELGAFSLHEGLRSKMLPILDVQYKDDDSFLNTGPIRWIDAESRFRPAIWTRLDRVLDCAVELDERLSKIKHGPNQTKDLISSPRHLLFFLCDIVAIFAPCTMGDIACYIHEITGVEYLEVELLIAIGVAMELLKFKQVDGVEYYYRDLADGVLEEFHFSKKYFGIGFQRAKVVGVMERIPECRRILKECV